MYFLAPHPLRPPHPFLAEGIQAVNPDNALHFPMRLRHVISQQPHRYYRPSNKVHYEVRPLYLRKLAHHSARLLDDLVVAHVQRHRATHLHRHAAADMTAMENEGTVITKTLLHNHISY